MKRVNSNETCDFKCSRELQDLQTARLGTKYLIHQLALRSVAPGYLGASSLEHLAFGGYSFAAWLAFGKGEASSCLAS